MAITDHPKTQGYLQRFGDGAIRFVHDGSQQLIMLGPIMLTIGKNIQVEGYEGWITKRIRAFMGTLGLELNDLIWTDATNPSLSTMNSLGTYLSASFMLRREIFRMYWATSSGQDRLCYVFKDIVSLLKGTSMTHIILIEEYLYSRYRELLSIRLLADTIRKCLPHGNSWHLFQPKTYFMPRYCMIRKQQHT